MLMDFPLNVMQLKFALMIFLKLLNHFLFWRRDCFAKYKITLSH